MHVLTAAAAAAADGEPIERQVEQIHDDGGGDDVDDVTTDNYW